jgi:hypothetical protein
MKIAAMNVVLPQPYLLFLGDTTEPGYAKTAFGLRDWAPQRCVGEFSCPGATVSTGLPFLTPAQARIAGAQAMVIGVANAGGFIPPAWLDAWSKRWKRAWTSSAACTRACAIPRAARRRERLGRRLIDMCANRRRAFRSPRAAAHRPSPADGRHRLRTRQEIHGAGARARLPVHGRRRDVPRDGTDRHPDRRRRHPDGCGRGGLRRRGRRDAHARCGADALGHHRRPGLAAASGVCGRVARVAARQPARRDRGVPRTRTRARPRPSGFPVPDVQEVIDLTLRLGARTSPHIRCAGVSLNTTRAGW